MKTIYDWAGISKEEFFDMIYDKLKSYQFTTLSIARYIKFYTDVINDLWERILNRKQLLRISDHDFEIECKQSLEQLVNESFERMLFVLGKHSEEVVK